jgi:hypothetical protein
MSMMNMGMKVHHRGYTPVNTSITINTRMCQHLRADWQCFRTEEARVRMDDALTFSDKLSLMRCSMSRACE